MSEILILDNEAVQALASKAHRKHRLAMARIQAVATGRARDHEIQIVVPTSVRVEAGWDRTSPAAATINRLGVADAPLGGAEADEAVALRAAHGVSIADAHLGVCARALAGRGRVAILTSDRPDMTAITEGTGAVIDLL